MFKHISKLIIGFTLAGLALTGCGLNGGEGSPSTSPASGKTAAGNQEGRPVTIGLTYIPNVQFAPFYVAKDENLFSWKGEADTNSAQSIALRHHGADEGLFNALMSGKEDMVVAFGDEATQAISQGMPLSIIGVLYQRYPVVVIARHDSGIKTWQDLKGKTVGLPGRYGSNWFGFQAGLHAAGLSLDDVKVAEIGYTQQTQLTTGKVDAVVGFSNNDLVRFQLAGVGVTTLTLPSETPLVGAVVVTTQEFATHEPEVCQATVNGMAKAIHKITAHPETALAATKKYDQTLTNDQAIAAARHVTEATNELIKLDHFDPKNPGAQSLVNPQKFRDMVTLLDKIGALSDKINLKNLDDQQVKKFVWPGA